MRTLSAADFGGDLTWVTTDPLPDPRLSQTSTADALMSGNPFVLVVDSVRYCMTPVCGWAVIGAADVDVMLSLLTKWHGHGGSARRNRATGHITRHARDR